MSNAIDGEPDAIHGGIGVAGDALPIAAGVRSPNVPPAEGATLA